MEKVGEYTRMTLMYIGLFYTLSRLEEKNYSMFVRRRVCMYIGLVYTLYMVNNEVNWSRLVPRRVWAQHCGYIFD